jgi:hypothetical protein
MPVEEPTGSIAVFDELHVPPDTESASGTEKPTHTNEAPEISDGDGLTVIVWVLYIVPQLNVTE